MRIVLFIFLAQLAMIAAPRGHAADDWSFLDNGQVRIGVRTNSGACIGFFSLHSPERNLLNHHDHGRFVQQSYYGERDGSIWDKQPWRWNPVQGGNWQGKPATLLAFTNDGRAIHGRSVGKHWATGAELPEVVFEETITLIGRVAHVRYRMSYTGTKSHPVASQELPAVFMDYALTNLVAYSGAQPWTGGALHRRVPGWPNESALMTENWAGYFDERDRGLAVFVPGMTNLTCYRYAGPPGPNGDGCSYLAPVKNMAITPGMVFEYDVFLAIGSVSEVRETFHQLKLARDQASKVPLPKK